MAFTKQLLEKRFSKLPHTLKVAKINMDPELYLAKKLQSALYLSLGMAAMTFMLVDKMEMSLLLVPVSFLVWFTMIFFTLMKQAEGVIAKRRKQIDQDVLFAGRFLLVKLNAGRTLIGAIEDASNSYGVANEYFRDIMKDVNLGTPLEKALEKASANCPSQMMRKILFQITNALEIGIDVHQILESVLDDIASQQLLEIEAYGKKLSSVALFYMLFAVVLPSLGMAIAIVIASLVSIEIGPSAFIVMAFFMMMLEMIFITVFKSIRPSVNV